jgi:hypothetical protein
METGHELEGPGVGIRVKTFQLSTSSSPGVGHHKSPIQRLPGTLYPEVKRPRREPDHSPPISVEFRNT